MPLRLEINPPVQAVPTCSHVNADDGSNLYVGQQLICADPGALQLWLWGLHNLTCRARRQYALPVARAEAARQAIASPACGTVRASCHQALLCSPMMVLVFTHADLKPWPGVHTLLAFPQQMPGLVRRLACLAVCRSMCQSSIMDVCSSWRADLAFVYAFSGGLHQPGSM